MIEIAQPLWQIINITPAILYRILNIVYRRLVDFQLQFRAISPTLAVRQRCLSKSERSPWSSSSCWRYPFRRLVFVVALFPQTLLLPRRSLAPELLEEKYPMSWRLPI